MSGEHTPGPWFRTGRCGVVTADKRTIGASWPNPKADDGSMDANACLMAAAPDLLALAYQYRNDLRYPPTGDSIERRLAAIEAAIARATGAA